MQFTVSMVACGRQSRCASLDGREDDDDDDNADED